MQKELEKVEDSGTPALRRSVTPTPRCSFTPILIISETLKADCLCKGMKTFSGAFGSCRVQELQNFQGPKA
jgi:hypothetical protein